MKTPFQILAKHDRKRFNEARKHLQRESHTMPRVMTKQDHAPQQTTDPHGVWRSREFLAMSYLNAHTGTLRLSICRTKVDNQGMWVADITWDELQQIKRECGYGDKWAVEIFPPDEHLVNVANMRHLWLVDMPAFAWVNRANLCQTCDGCGMVPSNDPDGDVMNTPCPRCNPHAEPEWIEWKGDGECPVDGECTVIVRLSNGIVCEPDIAANFVWSHDSYDDNIVAYRIGGGK